MSQLVSLAHHGLHHAATALLKWKLHPLMSVHDSHALTPALQNSLVQGSP